LEGLLSGATIWHIDTYWSRAGLISITNENIDETTLCRLWSEVALGEDEPVSDVKVGIAFNVG
jgi:hypothetical protein